MADPIKALADAARRARVVLHNMTLERDGKLRMFSRWQISDEPLRNDAMHVVPAIDKALAAYDAAQAQPAPTDAEIEAAVVKYGTASFLMGMLMDVHPPEPRRAEKDAAQANLLALIARLRGGAP